MKFAFHLEDIRKSFQRLIQRFPIETVVVVAITLVIMYSIHTENFTGWIPRMIYTLIVTFFSLLAMTLYRESKEAKEWDVLLPLLPIVYGIGFYMVNSYVGDFDLETHVFFLLHVSGFGFASLFAPYVRKILSDERKAIEYANYFTLVFWTKLMSGIVGGSVLLLGFIAIGSVTELFDLTGDFFRGKIYGYWATIAFSLITPLYALIHFPDPKEIKQDRYDTNRFFSFLVRFVGIPFILIYFIILYAYSVKVLANFHDWPNGIISWLVIGFSIFGYLVYIFSESYVSEGKFIATFRTYFPFAVLPQILMLFYAIYLRIAQYDLTMNRYFVVIFGVWLTIISLYYTISKQKNILILPVTLSIISMIISFGPWGVFTLPLERQYDRFIDNIEKAGILQNGKIIPLNQSIDMTLENEIVSEVSYLCSYRTCAKIRPLFEKTLSDAENISRKNGPLSISRKKYTGLSSWEAANAINKAMNVQRRYNNIVNDRKYINLYVDHKQQNSYYPLTLTGYESLFRVLGINSSAPGAQFISIDPDRETLTIRDGADTETLSIAHIVDSLKGKYGSTSSYTANQKDLEFTLMGKNHEIQVFLNNFSYKNPRYDKEKKNSYEGSMSIDGMALIKRKKQ